MPSELFTVPAFKAITSCARVSRDNRHDFKVSFTSPFLQTSGGDCGNMGVFFFKTRKETAFVVTYLNIYEVLKTPLAAIVQTSSHTTNMAILR